MSPSKCLRESPCRASNESPSSQAIKFKDVKIERITFELARLKAWRFGAKTERMNADQCQMFEETLAEDQASLEAQLTALQGEPGPGNAAPTAAPAKHRPRRQLADSRSLAPRRVPA